MEFVPFQKIGRLSREIVITEKIDGTNAVIAIDEDGSFHVGSRSRWLSATADNFGFYAWAMGHKTELEGLGIGRHYGEWWGPGIQRGYGLKEKKFSLFNTHRWGESRPDCCAVVPVLWRGEFDTNEIEHCMELLGENGSVASPGFMRPEGIVIFHSQSRSLFKKTFEGDAEGKGREPVNDMAS